MTIGDKLHNVMVLHGFPGNASTCKCMMTAAEKGVDLDCRVVDILNGENQTDKYLEDSPFGSVPYLRDAQFVIAGHLAIMSYLDDKGFGPSLVPRNGVVRAKMWHWIDIAYRYVAPHVDALLHELVYNPMTLDPQHEPNKQALEEARTALRHAFSMVDKQMTEQFVVGAFSLADLHWAPHIHFCYLMGEEGLIDPYENIKSWWNRVKTHPSTSKEKINAYEQLPSLDDIKGKVLKDIRINA